MTTKQMTKKELNERIAYCRNELNGCADLKRRIFLESAIEVYKNAIAKKGGRA